MTGRTRQCPEIVRARRLKKAIEFHDAAVLVEDVAPNAAVDLLVGAGIAAADAICCSRLGAHAAGESHNEAIALLEKAEPKVAKHLRSLLNLKSKVAYTHHSVTTDDHKKANRAASNLVEAARRIAQPATGKGG
jgi:phosphoribosyl 1,2-cyclic phosphodiesterase